MLEYVFTKGEICGGPDGGGYSGTIELPDAITWLIRELRLFINDWSTTDLLHCLIFNLLWQRQSLYNPQ